MLRPLALLPLVLLAACSSYYGYEYAPAPLEAEVRPRSDAEPAGRVLLTVRGVRKADDGRPAEVELRIRVENLGAAPFSLDTDDLVLLTADLRPLDAPRIEPGPNPRVGPGEVVTLDLYFPFAPGDDPEELDMSGLNVRWTVRFDDHVTTSTSTFERWVPGRYGDPWYHSHFSFGVGAVVE